MRAAKVYNYKDVQGSILENRIKKMRKAKGWTQAELAKAVGVTQAKKLFLSSLLLLAASLDIWCEQSGKAVDAVIITRASAKQKEKH